MSHVIVRRIFTLLVAGSLISGMGSAESKEKKETEKKDKDVLKYRVVVTATRTEQPGIEVGSSASVITSEELKKTGKTTVFEALKSIHGLDVTRHGGPGEVSSVFIRGAKSEHSLVMVDGIEMNDPVSPSRSFDFAHLTLDNVERIEIVRGPQSTLYGSDAMGGVIHIITKKGKGKPLLSASFEGGSYDSFRETLSFSGGTELFNYSMGISRFDTKGFSASHEKYGNTERDGYGNTSFSARLGIKPVDNLKISFVSRYTDARGDLDLMAGEGGDDPNSVYKTENFLLGIRTVLSLLKGKWEQKLGISFNNLCRDYENDEDPVHPFDSSEGLFKGSTLKLDWQHNLRMNKTNTLICGFEYEKEKGESEYFWETAWGPGSEIFQEKSVSNAAFYLQDSIKFRDTLFVTLGVRFDEHSLFSGVTTFRVAPALILKTGTKIKLTYGTGFKAPSLYQLYAPATLWGSVGNKNLLPEKSRGWDVGVEQYLRRDSLTIGLTCFFNSFHNLIQFDWSRGYINVSRAKTSGIEFFLYYRAFRGFTLYSSYTYTKTDDNDTGEKLLRRPNHKAALNANYSFLKKAGINIEIMYAGIRDDVYPYPERIEMEPYTLVNLIFSYDIKKSIQLFLRVENLFDKDYEVIKGYGTAGRSVYAGFRADI